MSERKCRVCGCTEERACATDAGPCHWVEVDLCSACVGVHKRPPMTSADIQALQAMPLLKIEMDAGAAFELLATIQLASRHPLASQSQTLQHSCALARKIQEHLSVTENLATLCEAGWNPESDVPREPESRIILPGG